MLTATYSLVAIAAEQDKACSILSRLQHYLQNAWQGLHHIDFAFLDNAFNRLLRFDEYCRNRKIELHLIPALRLATREADALIAELEALSAKGADILRGVRDQLATAFDLTRVRAGELCHSMWLYCDSLAARLKKEEEALLPLARRLLSFEEWFSLAEKFLSQDAQVSGRRRHADMSHRLSAPEAVALRN